MRRTLNIGLGGTGIKSILHIKKSLYSSGKGQDVSKIFENMRFYVIDSNKGDIADINKTLGELDSTAVDILSFKDDEFSVYKDKLSSHSINMTLDQMANGEHRNIENWLVKNSLKNIEPGSGEGASQIRNVGRYGFFKIYTDIYDALKSHFEKLNQGLGNNQNNVAAATVMGADAIDVNIICSIAGGTGSGSLLDVILLVNAFKENNGLNLNINPIIVLPDVFDGVFGENKDGKKAQEDLQGTMQKKRARATAYAVLSELETLNSSTKPFIIDFLSVRNPVVTQNEKFKVQWLPQEHKISGRFTDYTVKGSIWNLCYLLSAANLPKNTVVNSDKIGLDNLLVSPNFMPGKNLADATFQAIADFVYIKANDDATNDGLIRGFPLKYLTQINNILGLAVQNNTYTISSDKFKFNNLYGSFGISKVFTDNEKLIQASAFVLLKKYLAYKKDAVIALIPKHIVNDSLILKNWRTSDILKKLMTNKDSVPIDKALKDICNKFIDNLDYVIEGKISPQKIWEVKLEIENESFSFGGSVVKNVTLGLGELKRKLEEELDIRIRKLYEDAKNLSVDRDSSNDDQNGMSFYESLRTFCLELFEKYSWKFSGDCFKIIYQNYYVMPKEEVEKWLNDNSKREAINFPEYLNYLQDLDSIPKSKQAVTCKVIAEDYVARFNNISKKKLEYHAYKALKEAFLFRIQPYIEIDPTVTSSFLAIITKSGKFLEDCYNEVETRVKNSINSLVNLKETAFATPIMNDNITESYIDKRMVSAINAELGKNAKTIDDFSLVEKEIMLTFFNIKNVLTLKNLYNKTLGSVILSKISLNDKNHEEFFQPTPDVFIESLRYSCYLYLRDWCKLGKNTTVSQEFDNSYSVDPDTTRTKIISKSSILLKKDLRFEALAIANNNKLFSYFISKTPGDPLGRNRDHCFFSNDTNYLFNAEVVFPLASIDCISGLEQDYELIYNDVAKDVGGLTGEKATYLHSDHDYFKAFSVPFTVADTEKKRVDLKRVTSLLIESIMIGVINKIGGCLGFNIFAGVNIKRESFANNIDDFSNLLIAVKKSSNYEEELNTAIIDKVESNKVIDEQFGLEVKVLIGLRHLETNIFEKFKEVSLMKNPQNSDKIEAERIEKFLIECIEGLRKIYIEKTLNNVYASRALEKYDNLVLNIKNISQRGGNIGDTLTNAKQEFSSFLKQYVNDSFSDKMYIPVIIE